MVSELITVKIVKSRNLATLLLFISCFITPEDNPPQESPLRKSHVSANYQLQYKRMKYPKFTMKLWKQTKTT